jgi:hypothetical protein
LEWQGSLGRLGVSLVIFKSFFYFLDSINVTPTDHKIIISSTKRISKVVDFKFKRLSHQKLGGVTNCEGFIGFSKRVSLRNETAPHNEILRSMLGSLKVTNHGEACDSPYSGRPLPEGETQLNIIHRRTFF